jgi:amino acid adenylation domain-containing protein
MRPISLSPELSDLVRAFSLREQVTPFMTLLAAFELVLGRWSGQDDFAVGAPSANRGRTETQALIGYFINMVALRADLAGNPSVHGLLHRVRETCLDALEYQEIPLEVLIPALEQGRQRDASRSPLFQVMFVLQNNRVPQLGHLDLELSLFDTDHGTGTAKFDLALGFADTPEGFLGSVEFNTDLFETATIERFARHYKTLLEGLLADPDRRLSDLPLLAPEGDQEIADWSYRPAVVSQQGKVGGQALERGIHGLFEAQVRATPTALALIPGDARGGLSYSDLNAHANRLAHYLRVRGVGAEVPVGLAIDDPINRILGVLGVLKAGGAYVPLDPWLPGARLGEMLAISRARILVSDRREHARAFPTVATAIDLVTDATAIAAQTAEDPGVPVHAEQLAYIVFTSGSTGRPKGVLVPHCGLVAVAAAWEQEYDLRCPPLRHLQAAGFGFDVFAGEWIRALTTGGTLVMCPREVVLDPSALADFIRDKRIDSVELVPALADQLASHLGEQGGDLAGLRLLAVGSDTLRAELYYRLRRLLQPDGRLVNSYGLTEATIDSTYFEGPLDFAPGDGPVPIGRPMPGTRASVVDERGRPVPVGTVGELYVGGSGVARGYAADPRQTAERFVPDSGGPPGSRLYATGDRARWREGGVLELVGRRDGQVKIRGFRVELGEVEAALDSAPGVRETAVITRNDQAQGELLAAFIVGRDGHTVDLLAVRRFLRARLPRPMIPAQIRVVDSLPRTISGKVDRQILAEALTNEIATVDCAKRPRDEVEAELVAIWQDLLRVEAVGVDDDFFDLGGHSLLAVRLAARIQERFGRTVALSEILLDSTIEDLAARLRTPSASPENSLLIELSSTGRGRPLTLVHPVGGGVLCYRALSRRLGAAAPVLGIQAAGVDDDTEPQDNLERMASRYVEILRAKFPEGPYLLGGWSFGGVVAFEMARQLTQAGHAVSLVCLIDCAVPTPRQAPLTGNDEESLLAFAADLTRNAGRHPGWELARVLSLDPTSKANGTIDHELVRREIESEIGPDRLRRLHGVFRANRRALDSYSPGPYRGKIVLVEAGSSRPFFEPTRPDGWSELAIEGLNKYRVPGDHYTILEQPSVERLAEIVTREIQACRWTT